MERSQIPVGGGHRDRIGHIHHLELALHLGGDGFGSIGISIEHYHGGAGMVQRPGDPGSDPRTSTCDDVAIWHGRYL